MTRLILVRHGETHGNVQQLWHGAMDSPLTVRGHQQVAATAVQLAKLNQAYAVAAFYVSPLPRAQQTAAAIAAAIGQQPIIEAGLREFDLGEWEGRTFLDLRNNENLWGRWRQDPHFMPPHGESPHSFHARVLATMHHLAALHPGATVLIVTHGGVICNVLAAWLGRGPEDWRNWEPHNCAITLLQSGSMAWQGLLVNDISHLPTDAIATHDGEAYA